jgi:hypothetical protein
MLILKESATAQNAMNWVSKSVIQNVSIVIPRLNHALVPISVIIQVQKLKEKIVRPATMNIMEENLELSILIPTRSTMIKPDSV